MPAEARERRFLTLGGIVVSTLALGSLIKTAENTEGKHSTSTEG